MRLIPGLFTLLLASLLLTAPLGAQALRTELVAEGFSRPILLTSPPGHTFLGIMNVDYVCMPVLITGQDGRDGDRPYRILPQSGGE